MASGNNGFLGGMFDFNGDGITDMGEAFIAYKIYEAVMSSFDEDDTDEQEECPDD